MHARPVRGGAQRPAVASLPAIGRRPQRRCVQPVDDKKSRSAGLRSMSMNPDLHADISRRLVADFEFVDNGRWLQQGRCPDCQKKELFASSGKPFVVKCGRENKCGYVENIKTIYPDLFEQWSERYASSPASPNAAADAYMRFARGFDLARV